MSLITRRRIRLRLDVSSMEAIVDTKTSKPPRLWRGNDVQFEIGVFYGDMLQSISNIASITLQVKAARTDVAAVMEATASGTDLDNTLTDDTWDDESQQHALIAFTGAETNLTLGSGITTKEYWLVISALTTDTPGRDITLGAGAFHLDEDGYLTAGTPPEPEEDYYNKAESDARYMLASMAGQNTRWSDGKWYIQNRSNETLWHEIAPDGEGDQVHLFIGPGVTL